jgi:hypothetical protein
MAAGWRICSVRTGAAAAGARTGKNPGIRDMSAGAWGSVLPECLKFS